MKSTHSLLLLLAVIAASILSGIYIASPVSARVFAPDRLEIARTPGITSNVSYELVVRPQLVQTLYAHMLALPVAPESQICPMYIIANYQLTFFHNNTVVRRAKALNGQCGQVTLSSTDIRTADSAFWTLIRQANKVGTLIAAP